MPPETAEQAANRVADRAIAGKHNNSQGSQASPGADSVQERVVQRQVGTVEYVSQPETGPNYARLRRLEELLTQITDETSEIAMNAAEKE